MTGEPGATDGPGGPNGTDESDGPNGTNGPNGPNETHEPNETVATSPASRSPGSAVRRVIPAGPPARGASRHAAVAGNGGIPALAAPLDDAMRRDVHTTMGP